MDSAMGPHAVLRGSLVTALWVPERVAQDIDFVILGEGWSLERLKPLVSSVVGSLSAVFEPIWAETPWPGWRVHLSDADDAVDTVDAADMVGTVQVDFGWGDPLALPPVLATIHGVELPVVTPEVMLAWKIHSLVEFGPRGRWSAKTLADLVLIHRRARLDEEKVRRCLALAFSSRNMSTSDLDGLLDDPTWGQSRGSRNKWKSFQKKVRWAPFTLNEALSEAREIVRAYLRAGAGQTPPGTAHSIRLD
jgi:hypothetical protein